MMRAPTFGNIRLRHTKCLAVVAIEADRQIPRQFKMLPLILPDRHEVCLIKQDVRGHQDRIVKHSDTDILELLSGLVLKLRHPLQLGHARNAIENPGQLGMLGDVRLDEDSGNLSDQSRRAR